MESTLAILLIGDLPAHPLVSHSVVVLLPLAALGSLLIAAMPSMRRRFGVAVLLLAAAGVGSVPIATQTGEQLETVLPANQPLIEAHQDRGEDLLAFALAFVITVVLLVIAGRLADRERGAAKTATESGEPATGGVPRTWRRLALVAAALVAFSAVAVTVQVIRVGHSGAAAVWSGVGS